MYDFLSLWSFELSVAIHLPTPNTKISSPISATQQKPFKSCKTSHIHTKKMGKKKKERVPNVLWRQFRDKAASLSKTIISIIPKFCNCNGKGKCIRCVFGNGDDDAAMTYLIRPDDPIEYRRLMTTCFVVVPHNAPPFPPLSSFTRHWSQLQIVEKTIQALFNKATAPSNVLCHGYQKFKLNSTIVKVLTSCTWELALERVGDSIMIHLLMHTLIFMSITCNAHQQVAGPLVSQLVARLPMRIPLDDSGSSMHETDARYKRKRGRGNGKISKSEEPASKVPCRAGQENSFGSVDSEIVVCQGKNSPKVSPMISEKCLLGQHATEEQPIERLKVEPRKRLRLPSWQRRKRRKKLALQDCCTQDPSRKNLNDVGDFHKNCQHGWVNNKGQSLVVPTSVENKDNQNGADLYMEQSLCPCCSVFQSLSRVPKDAEITRKFMFYNVKYSSSLFLKKHILYSLKPGFAGVSDLLLHIFGLPNTSSRNLPASCFHKRGLCSQGSICLYHSLVKLLKVFLRRAKKCHHIRLLEKHCPSQPLFQLDRDGDVGSSLEPRKMESEKSNSKQDVFQGTDQLPKRLTCTETRGHRRTTEVIQRQFGLSRPYCLKDEVVSYIWAVCRNIVPPDLLGLPLSRRILRRNISKFIKLRRFEKFSLKQCLHKLEVSKFPFLSNIEASKCSNAFVFKPTSDQISVVSSNSQNIGHCPLKQMVLERWIFWFFSHIVVPLVQDNFYVTESEQGKQNLYYYRKSIWQKLSNRVITSLKDQTYRSLNNASVAEILSKRSFGFSKVRLCPKENGARPIANLKAASRFCIKRSLSHAQLRKKKRIKRTHNRNAPFLKSVNTVLRNLQVIFKDLKVNEPERWGSTVFSYNDIHRKLCSFLRHLKEGQPTMPMVYIVVSDVQKAFDTVKQDKLLSVIDEIQMADKYSLQKSCEIFCRKKCLWISENRKLMIEGNNSGLTEDIPPVHQRTCQTVVVNQEQGMTVRREELMYNLKEHLKNNVLKLGQYYFLQTVGIPQGSVLSSLLCTLYYGHMERNVIFPYLSLSGQDMPIHVDNGSAALVATSAVSFSSPKYLLLRFVDDFLLVSTSKKQASSFFSRLRRGFHAYNCYMNQEKFCMNFDYGGTHKVDSKRLLVGSDGVSFMQWSGLLINSCTLEVQADYSRYLNDHMSSTLTVSWQHRPGRQLKAKLRAYMRPKCHPIFYDTSINSPATIRLNVYQAFVVCAMKFHCYVRELSFWCKLQPGSCLSSIEGSIRYMYRLMKRRMYKVNYEPDCNQVLKVAKQEVIWLGLTAYIRVLSKKKSRHIFLLRLLRAKLAAISNVRISSGLKYAVDDSHSSFLWKIKY
ncbi:telomerase reverse transcriptase-like isoform X2 [Chenopodium quinoa]|uniref:telomerase reverse transcriptase-like isoform X2 n=1 Tax=Chenopodium quinoa TaxID=63459 RepID=UPI000B771093|nr:telomerase reverse transcriptase-like isoform X2 [Chenopodium quinoa]